MEEFYLRFFQEVDSYDGGLLHDCIALVYHSDSISEEEALLKAQKFLAGNDFIITKVEFPYLWYHKFEKLKEEY